MRDLVWTPQDVEPAANTAVYIGLLRDNYAVYAPLTETRSPVFFFLSNSSLFIEQQNHYLTFPTAPYSDNNSEIMVKKNKRLMKYLLSFDYRYRSIVSSVSLLLDL